MSGMDDLALEKALKKMPAKEISLMAYRGLQKHVEACEASSARVLVAIKIVGSIVAALALEKIAEVLKIPHLPGVL